MKNAFSGTPRFSPFYSFLFIWARFFQKKAHFLFFFIDRKKISFYNSQVRAMTGKAVLFRGQRERVPG